MSGIIKIGHSRIIEIEKKARLESDVTINNEKRTIFFEVPKNHLESLTVGKADPFLATFINYSIKTEKIIECIDPVSERLLFSIKHIYIPTLVHGSSEFKGCDIQANTICTSSKQNKKLHVGAGMSFGCDSMYTLSQNNSTSEYPIEYLCNFNNGVYGDCEQEKFHSHSARVSKFAKEMGLNHISVNTNIQNILFERYLDVYSQRNFACILALQGLLSVYLYASGHDEEKTAINPYNSALYDVVSVDCFSTDTLNIFLSGCESTRVEKLKVLGDYWPAFRYLHPCFKNQTKSKNCGLCKKDIRDMIILYSLGKWKNYIDVYNWKNFEQKIPMHLAFLISKSDDHLYREALDCWKEAGFNIPKQSYVYATMLKKILNSKEAVV